MNTYLYVGGNPVADIDPSGEGKVGKAIKLTKKAWNHIFNRHVSKTALDATKFRKPNMIKKYIDKAIKNPSQVTQEGSRVIIEKYIGKRLGTKGEEYIRVVVDKKTGEIITAYPVKSMKTIVPGANIGTTLFGTGLMAEVVNFVNPLSDLQDILNLF